MNEKKQTCENCIYWEALSSGPTGECRRYPPKIVIPKNGIESTEWPKTTKGSWCGEHTLKCFIIGCDGCYEREGPDL